jgi:hypothetical protein
VAANKMEREQKIARKNSLRTDGTRPLIPFAIERPEAVGNPLHHESAAEATHAPFRSRRSIDRTTNGSAHGTPMYGMVPAIPEEEEDNGKPFDVIEMLEQGQNTRPNRSRGSSNADTMNRRLSMTGRGPTAIIMPQLLAYVRSTFLSMVRVHYWHDIEQGKLPRKSKSGKFLLYSVEVGLDEVNMEAGARDWACVEDKLDTVPHEIQFLTWWEEHVPETWFTYPSRYLNKLECTREERTVYMLTSFIAAHEHAQTKIHGYLRVEENDDDGNQQSPEELKVIAESKLAVGICCLRCHEIVVFLVPPCCVFCVSIG